MPSFLLLMIVIIGLTHTATSRDSKLSCVKTLRDRGIPENLNISWVIGELFHEKLDVNVSWYTGSNRGSCTETSPSSCLMQYGDSQSVDFDTPFFLEVVLSSPVNGSSVFNRTWFIDQDDCVKPLPVQGISLRAINSSCIEARWYYSRDTICSEYFNKLYKLKIGWDNKERVVYVNGSCGGLYTFYGLHPARDYTVNVFCRELNYKDDPIGHWSEGSRGLVTTPEDVPSGAPQLVPCGYSYIQDDCNKGGKRTVSVFWKEVEPSKRNGIITRYVQEIRTVGSDDVATNVISSKGSGPIRNEMQLDCDRKYMVRMKAGTEVGVSSVYSETLDIPTHKTYPYSIQLIPEVHKDQDIVSLFWTTSLSSTRNSSSVTVFWCGRDSQGKCATGIDWRRVNGPRVSNLTIRLAPSSTAAQFLFGMSLDSRGIIWTPCRFIANTEITYPGGLRVDSQGPSEALSIRWDNPPCGSRPPSAFIENFVVRICEVQNQHVHLCQGESREIRVAGKAQSIIITDTVPSSLYMIQIAAVDRQNNTSIYSNPIYSAPTEGENNAGAIITIVAVTLSLFPVAVIVLYLILYLRKRFRQYPQITSYALGGIPETDGCAPDTLQPCNGYSLVRSSSVSIMPER